MDLIFLFLSSYLVPFLKIYIVALMTFNLFLVLGRTMFGILCLVTYLIYKFKRRHLSLDDTIEEFLRNHKNLQPVSSTPIQT